MRLRNGQFFRQMLILKNVEKIEVFDQSSNFFISLGWIQMQDLWHISPVSYPPDHGSMIENFHVQGL